MTKNQKYAPVRTLVLVYICLSVIGFLALSLPGAATRPLTNLEALFTAISAITLTGLQVCDFAGIFTAQGQIIVLVLIELGAVTIISFSLYFGWLLGKSFLFTDDAELLDPQTKPIKAFVKLLGKTCLYLFIFELGCSGIIYAFWTGDITYSPAQKLQYAFFHGVSVFCHSGFSNLPGNFSNPHIRHSYLLLLALTGVIVLGSAGYAATFDIISIRRLRERMLNPAKDWTLQTRIVYYATLILLATGSIIWFATEYNHSLQNQKLVESLFTSIFNVAGARGAGFYSINVSALTPGLYLLYIILMLIGVSATSPGGGIKTSLAASVFVRKAGLGSINTRLFLYFVAGTLILSLIFMMAAAPGFSKTELRFEVLSAFTNTGLSSGIAPTLPDAAKCILMADMLLGRIGLPVMLYLFAARKSGEQAVLLS